MSEFFIYIIIAVIFAVLVGIVAFYFITDAGDTGNEEALRNLIQSQRKKNFSKDGKSNISKGEAALLVATQGEKSQKREDVSSPSLRRKLYYARWKITPLQFNIIKYSIALIISAGIYPFVQIPLLVGVFGMTIVIINSFLLRKIRKRFDSFDRDYPDFLMAFVSRLKSGMNSLSALQSAASGFSENSLLRAEVELMIERIKLGIEEEQAIGTFGETIPHPEIDLFVQGLILSRRVGGNFSKTIERLAKQVRKRQEFRKKAVGAVSMEKGSGIMIAVVMVGTMLMIYFTVPNIITGAFTTEMGQLIFQSGATITLFGFYLSKIITDIKV